MSSDFHGLRVVDVRSETDDAFSVTFAPDPVDVPAFGFAPGQYLTFRATIDGEDVRRNYSVCTPPGGPLRVGIKQVPGGRFSTWARAHLRPGAIVDAQPPQGTFTQLRCVRRRIGDHADPIADLHRAGG